MSSLDLTTVRKAPRAVAVVVFSLLAAPLTARAYDPDGLWKVVSTKCVPNQRDTGNPAACIEVNVSKGVDSGFLVLKDSDPLKPYEYLLIPTQPITGIESKKVLEAGASNYFEDAWAARSYLITLLKAPLAWDMVGLAVNSAEDRSQDQLHIHIDCIRWDIRTNLRSREDALSNRWSELKLPAPDHPYMIMKLETDSLAESNPFRLLADGISGAKEHMDLETLVLIGAVFKDGKRGF